MSDLVALFDALYSRLLLRDVFGKVIPGLVVIFALAASVSTVEKVADHAQSMGFWSWVLILGSAWVMAFSVQAFGETTGLIRYHKKEWSDEDFYTKRLEFESCATQDERQQMERFVVIKEACGNGYLAAALALITLAADRIVKSGVPAFQQTMGQSWHVIVVLVALIVFLARMHFIHVERQSTYLTTVVRSKSGKSGGHSSS